MYQKTAQHLYIQALRQNPALNVFHLFILLVAFMCTLPHIVHAGQQVGNACDAEYYDALKSRAWLEAQREIAQNQNLIYKPDSVLQYSCFHKFLELLETDEYYKEHLSFTRDHGDQAETKTITDFLHTFYLSGNFIKANEQNGDIDGDNTNNQFIMHNYLGGRLDGHNYEKGNTAAEDGYNDGCNDMQKVWYAAKCMDFIDKDIDEFHDFTWYDSNEKRFPRKFPRACSGTPNPKRYSEIWVDAWTNEGGGKPEYYLVMKGVGSMGEVGFANQIFPKFDPYKAHLDMILPRGHDDFGGCAAPIPTGITVQRTSFTPSSYPDAVCPNPGCYYVPQQENQIGTCQY